MILSNVNTEYKLFCDKDPILLTVLSKYTDWEMILAMKLQNANNRNEKCYFQTTRNYYKPQGLTGLFPLQKFCWTPHFQNLFKQHENVQARQLPRPRGRQRWGRKVSEFFFSIPRVEKGPKKYQMFEQHLLNNILIRWYSSHWLICWICTNLNVLNMYNSRYEVLLLFWWITYIWKWPKA